MNENIRPKISIITVSYNAVITIEQAILSVINQTYSNIEYIIIDGKSTDGTADIIKKYEKKISYWVSEPDEGIYDAMNKGIVKATGDYIYFLGADDELFKSNCIENIINIINLQENVDVFYGNIMMIDRRFGLQKCCGYEVSKKEILNGHMIPHQGMFTSRQLMKKFLFDIKYKIAADFDFMVRCMEKDVTMKYINQIIAYYDVNGSSSQDKLRYKEYKEILNAVSNSCNLKKIERSHLKSKIYKVLIYGCTKLKIAKKVKLFLGWHKIGEI